MFTKTDIEKYFNAEKNESLLFIVVGIIAIVLALLFFFYLKTQWHKGLAIPLLIIGIMHFIIGYSTVTKCDESRKRNVYAYDMNPGQLKDNEIPRLQKMKKNFVLYRNTEIILLLAGAGLIFYFHHATGNAFWAGFGVALMIEALLSLGLLYFAEKRATIYSSGLSNFVEQLRK